MLFISIGSKLLRIEDKNPYDIFVESLKTGITKKEYDSALLRFMDKYELVSYEKIKELRKKGMAKEAMDLVIPACEQLLKLSVKEAQDYVIDYILFLKARNLSEGFITQQQSALKGFFDMNDILLNWSKISQYKGEFKRKKKTGPYSHEQIKTLLGICDIRTRVIVYMFSSMGIRIDAVHELQLKHFKPISDIYQFTIYPGSNEEYITFCSPECRQAIECYLAFRERQGEKLTDESYLIRQQFDMNDLTQIRNESKPVSTSTINNIIWNLLIKAGLRVVDHSQDKMKRNEISQNHGFRKFFTTQVRKSGLSPEVRWLLEGHALPKNDGSYVGPGVTEDEFYQEYCKAIPKLTIDQSLNQQKIIEAQAEKLDDIQILKDTIKSLRNEVAGIRPWMRNWDEKIKEWESKNKGKKTSWGPMFEAEIDDKLLEE